MATAARTSFGCFQVRSAIRFIGGDSTRNQSRHFEKQIERYHVPMGRREYGQECSLASALDAIGERWSLLVVRELSLGPLRFSELVRSVGGAPTDVLTKRLRDLEADGVVARRELGAPAAATVYELTRLGRGLERPMFELARWGMEIQRAEDVVGLLPSSLPNALRTVLQPQPEAAFDLGLGSMGQTFALRGREGWI